MPRLDPRAIAYEQLQPMVVASHNLSAGRPCERRDPSPLAPKVKKGPCSSTETRVRAVWVPAFAGTTSIVGPAPPPACNVSDVTSTWRRLCARRTHNPGRQRRSTSTLCFAHVLCLHSREPTSRDPVYRGDQLPAKATGGAPQRRRLLICPSLRRSSPRLCRSL